MRVGIVHSIYAVTQRTNAIRMGSVLKDIVREGNADDGVGDGSDVCTTSVGINDETSPIGGHCYKWRLELVA